MVLDRDYLAARKVELAGLLDQSVASSSYAQGLPSEDLRARVHALYDVEIHQATTLDAYPPSEVKMRLASLVEWLIQQLQFLGGSF